MAAPSLPSYVDHLIVGSGFAGLCAAIKLAEDGETDYVVLEKADDVGGTWRDNTYPGACCDVPSQLYSFSFARNPDWSSSYSPQPEIQALPRAASPTSTASADRFVFDTELEHAAWDDAAQRWHGPYDVRRAHRSRPSSSAAGGLSAPRLPEIEGIETFGGRALPLRPLGPLRRPGRQAGRGDRHRRLGDPDRARGAAGGRPPRRLPAHRPVGDPAQRPHLPEGSSAPPCAGSRRCAGSTAPASTGRTRATCRRSPGSHGSAAPAEKAALANIHHGIKDPALRAKVTPTLQDRLQADAALQHLLPRARRRQRRRRHRPDRPGHARPRSSPPTASEHPVDVIVVATGFWTTELPIAEHIVGRDRPHARRRAGPTAAWRRTRARPSTASRTCSCCRPQHRPGPHQHGVHHRVAGRLPPRRGAHPAAPPVRRRRAARGRASAAGTPTCSAG